MCGILAEFSSKGPVGRAAFGRMLDTLSARGPDGEGVWGNPTQTVMLGHRRLAIMDLSDRGRQPLANETGDVQVVHNGEIYNFRALRNELEAAGHRFASDSDSEVIVHAYEEWGEACTDRLRGIFAFVLWDERRGRMLMARDQLGVKPLYWWRNDGGFVVASEAKAVLAHPNFLRRPDVSTLRDYLAWRYVPEGRSAFAGLETVKPGCRVTWQNGDASTVMYWSPVYRPVITDEVEAVEMVRAAMRESLVLQQMSDVPVGVLVSGGIDSSAVLGGLHEVTGTRLPGFTTGFAEPGFDERSYACMAAEAHGSGLDAYVMDRRMMMEMLPDYIEWHDEPTFDYSAIPVHLMSRRARASGVKVLFAGDGGDELFAGYTRYERIARRGDGWRAALSRWTGTETERRARLYFDEMGYLNATARRRLMTAESGHDPQALARDYMADGVPVVVAAQLCDLRTFLVSDILAKVDRASMAAGVEVRVPWLDHRLVELAFMIDVRVNFAGGERKRVLKRAVEPWVPTALLTGRKKGFGFPMNDWIDHDWRAKISGLVSKGSLVARGVWHGSVAADMVASGSGEQCWLLLCAELWARRWLDDADVRTVLARAGLEGKEAV